MSVEKVCTDDPEFMALLREAWDAGYDRALYAVAPREREWVGPWSHWVHERLGTDSVRGSTPDRSDS